jgi:hypothetical protein
MSITKYIGTGAVGSADFKEVSWVGLTKGGNAVTIKLHDAINMGNIDWTFAEKNDVVPSVEFTACYDNTDAASDSTLEPFEVEINGTSANASDGIILGAGKFYINGTLVALTRGGGQFTVEREYREINADGVRGAVKGRVVMEGSRPKLTMNVLTMLANITSLYSSVEVSA